MLAVAVLLSVAFGIARFAIPTVSEVHAEDIFKDMAHLFVGALFGAGCVRVRQGVARAYGIVPRIRFWLACRNWKYLALAVAMTVLEVIAFKYHKQ